MSCLAVGNQCIGTLIEDLSNLSPTGLRTWWGNPIPAPRQRPSSFPGENPWGLMSFFFLRERLVGHLSPNKPWKKIGSRLFPKSLIYQLRGTEKHNMQCGIHDLESFQNLYVDQDDWKNLVNYYIFNQTITITHLGIPCLLLFQLSLLGSDG